MFSGNYTAQIIYTITAHDSKPSALPASNLTQPFPNISQMIVAGKLLSQLNKRPQSRVIIFPQ